MSDKAEPCDTCTEHSGVESRQRTIIWLLGLLIAIMVSSTGYNTITMNNIDKQVAIIPIQLKYLTDNDEALKESFKSLEVRVKLLEEKTHGK